MDIVNFDALTAQDRIITPSQVDPEEDYFIIGKYTNHYTTNSQKYTKYPVYAIKAGDVMGGGNNLLYKIYTSLVSATMVIVGSAAGLDIGKSYMIVDLQPGDDFTNVGFVTVGVAFTATGTTPTVWVNKTEVYNVTDSTLNIIVLEDTIGVTAAFEAVSTPSGLKFGIAFRTPGLFLINKLFEDNAEFYLIRASNNVLISGNDFGTYDHTPCEFKIYN